MTTTEKLQRIKAKCEDDITIAKGFLHRSSGVYLADLKRHIAACESTITAINGLSQPMPEGYCHPDNSVNFFDHKLADEIIAAWEGLA